MAPEHERPLGAVFSPTMVFSRFIVPPAMPSPPPRSEAVFCATVTLWSVTVPAS